eukprot:CAMPEP_0119278656 /NCGR_PEP_ID=MMETSP1329-20130426/19472_1 /TAXON_ID=114041 /ORGANISM="Genus nov. species nov., Strain RCC1024" /LENGTH=406 /DNA_ID=CAMNT_0007279175 /DNA_START=68 /DNA_END=1285 /DNA_ORIENTATION=-
MSSSPQRPPLSPGTLHNRGGAEAARPPPGLPALSRPKKGRPTRRLSIVEVAQHAVEQTQLLHDSAERSSRHWTAQANALAQGAFDDEWTSRAEAEDELEGARATASSYSERAAKLANELREAREELEVARRGPQYLTNYHGLGDAAGAGPASAPRAPRTGPTPAETRRPVSAEAPSPEDLEQRRVAGLKARQADRRRKRTWSRRHAEDVKRRRLAEERAERDAAAQRDAAAEGAKLFATANVAPASRRPPAVPEARLACISVQRTPAFEEGERLEALRRAAEALRGAAAGLLPCLEAERSASRRSARPVGRAPARSRSAEPVSPEALRALVPVGTLEALLAHGQRLSAAIEAAKKLERDVGTPSKAGPRHLRAWQEALASFPAMVEEYAAHVKSLAEVVEAIRTAN